MAFTWKVASTCVIYVFTILLLLPWLLVVEVFMQYPIMNICTNKGINQAITFHADKHLVHVTPDQLEEVRRQVASGVRTTQAFLRSSLTQLLPGNANMTALLAEAEDRLRVIELDVSSLDRFGELTAWREKESATLSQEVQRRIYASQNPPDCASTKKIVCEMFRGAGAGSLIHHLVYCLMAAYGSGKVLVVHSRGWGYSPAGWEVLFQPLSRNCVNVSSNVTVPWPGNNDVEAIMFPTWDNPVPKPLHQPMAVPQDIASRLQRFHEMPSAWWAGQFITYIMRLQPEMQQIIDQVKKQINFSHPIVGVHVRRTDKRVEVRLRPLEEYMTHVENYYLGLDLVSSSGIPVRRRVFLASELGSVITEARTKYPHYEFIWHNNSAESPPGRYSLSGLKDLVTELYFLAHSDYLVCTFSSNICRLAYEMMQPLHADAPSRIISLDYNFCFYQSRPRHLRVRFPHRPDRSAKKKGVMQADAGQMLNANIRDTNKLSGYKEIVLPGKAYRIKYLPDYKVREVLDVVNVTLPEHVRSVNKEN